MNLTYLKVASGLLILGSLFYLVCAGKLDATSYAELAIGLLTGVGAHAATAWQPSEKTNAAPPAPAAPAQPAP